MLYLFIKNKGNKAFGSALTEVAEGVSIDLNEENAESNSESTESAENATDNNNTENETENIIESKEEENDGKID